MRYKRARFVVAMFFVVCALAKKKNKDEMTQTLELPKDPPAVATGDARKLTFQVSPLSGKGLLSAQVREAMKAILKENGNSTVVHIRAFVAGSGDVRRVSQIVSDVLSEKHLPLPSVSVALAGALPVEGAQVVLEAVSLAKKDVSAQGVRFVAGARAGSLNEAASLLASKVESAQTLRVTCFASGTEGGAGVSMKFPAAAVDVVQPVRLAAEPFAECEAVVRGGDANTLAFTGTRVAFGAQEKDAALAWQRLDRDLTDAGASAAVYTRMYELNGRVGEMARRLRGSSPPEFTVPVEGLAAMDAGFAVDAVGVLNR